MHTVSKAVGHAGSGSGRDGRQAAGSHDGVDGQHGAGNLGKKNMIRKEDRSSLLRSGQLSKTGPYWGEEQCHYYDGRYARAEKFRVCSPAAPREIEPWLPLWTHVKALSGGCNVAIFVRSRFDWL